MPFTELDEMKAAAEKNNSLFFLEIIAHFLASAAYYAGWSPCETNTPEVYKNTVHPGENLLTRAIYSQSHYYLELWDEVLRRPYPHSWSIIVPEQVRSLLSQIELFGPEKKVRFDELLPVWESWLAYNGVVLNPHVYEIL